MESETYTSSQKYYLGGIIQRGIGTDDKANGIGDGITSPQPNDDFQRWDLLVIYPKLIPRKQ